MFMFENAPKYDKLEIAGRTLQDTICNFFAGNHPITTVNSARATSEIVRGLHYYFSEKKLIEKYQLVSSRIDGDSDLKEMNNRICHRSNFAKHANSDPLRNKDYHEADAYIAIHAASIDFCNLVGALAGSDIDLIHITGIEDSDALFGALTKIDTLVQLFDAWLKMSDRKQQSKEEYFALIRKNGLHLHDEESDYALIKYEANIYPKPLLEPDQ